MMNFFFLNIVKLPEGAVADLIITEDFNWTVNSDSEPVRTLGYSINLHCRIQGSQKTGYKVCCQAASFRHY